MNAPALSFDPRTLGITSTLPFTSLEVFTLPTHNADRGDLFYFPTREGMRPRWLVKFDALTLSTLSRTPQTDAFPGSSALPSVGQLSGYTVTLRAPNGEYLWRNMPASVLASRPDGDAFRRLRFVDALPIDWDRSFVRVLTAAQPVAFGVAAYFVER